MSTTIINPIVPVFLEIGNKHINVASISYIQRVHGMRGTDVFIYLNVSKPDGKLQSIQLETQEEVDQIAKFINSHEFGNAEKS